MKITWLGHGSFRMEIADQILLIDPWFTGNPAFEGHDRSAAIAGTTHILVTHGHGDHAADAVGLAKDLGVPVVGIYDLMSWWESTEQIATVGFNKGGTVTLGDVAVTMVNAVHSSSIGSDAGPTYAGAEAGFMISGEGRTVYVSGDTDVTADMGIWNELHQPEIGILSAGGHFTMDMARAAYAARTFFNFSTVIPCHYRTFPFLEQTADALVAGLPGVKVIEPEVLKSIEF